MLSEAHLIIVVKEVVDSSGLKRLGAAGGGLKVSVFDYWRGRMYRQAEGKWRAGT